MNKLMRRLRGEDGQALVMVIVMIITLSLTTVTVVELTGAGSRSGKRDAANSSAYDLAEAGLATAFSKLSAAADPTVSDAPAEHGGEHERGHRHLLGHLLAAHLVDHLDRVDHKSSDPTAGAVKRTLTETATLNPLVPGATVAAWDRVFQALPGCLDIPDTVHIPASVGAKGDICLHGDATITGASSNVEAGGNVVMDGTPSSNQPQDPATASGWTTSTNVYTSNNTYATNSVAKSSNGAYLTVTNWGFTIPAGATILGIQLNIEDKASATSSLKDETVQLLKAGTATGANKAVTGTLWGTTDTTVGYGAANDLWSAAWTPADINASTFGVRLRVANANSSSSRTASVDYVNMTVTYQTVSAVIGTSGTPVNSVQVGGKCQYGSMPQHTPCSSSDGVYASTVGTSPPDLTKPSIDFAYWYANAKPGPMHNCTSGSFPRGFDNNSVYDNSLPSSNDSLEGDMTPHSSSYDCQYWENGQMVGQIAWDHVSHVMKIKGTIFIDGDVRWDEDGAVSDYQGRGIIYSAGDTEFDEVVCAGGNGTNDCYTGNMSAWDPNQNMLIIVAGGSAEYDQGATCCPFLPGAFQGVMWAKDTCHIHQDFRSSGPIICDTVLIDDEQGPSDPTFYSWPPLQSLIAGQMYGSFGSASGYSLTLGPEKG